MLEAVALTERDVPDDVEVDHNKMTATFVRTPALGDVPAVVMEPNLGRRILREELIFAASFRERPRRRVRPFSLPRRWRRRVFAWRADLLERPGQRRTT